MPVRIAAIAAGVVLLVIGLRWFARLPSTTASRVLVRTVAGLLVGVLGFLAATGRLQWLYAVIGSLLAVAPRVLGQLPLLRRLLRGRGAAGGAAAGQQSSVTARFVRMTMEHGSGQVDGVVLEGRFEGARLDELEVTEVLSLLRECRVEDEESARLIEAYLDQRHPQWREEAGSAEAAAGADGLTVEQAWHVLGLSAGASEAEVVAAHRRLIRAAHPDRGGNAWLAAKINQARDVLLAEIRGAGPP